MRVNNFKELEREQASAYEQKTEKIGNSIQSNVNVFQFFGEIVELYFSKVIGMFVSVSGGSPETGGISNADKSRKKQQKYPNGN
jgi:hypothetical protein